MGHGSSKRTNLSRYFRSRPAPPSLRIGSEISRGAYGSVYEGELDGRPVAVKKIHRILLEATRDQPKEALEKMVKDFEKECRLLEDLKHRHIVGFSGAFYDVRNEEPILVMERMKENLRDLLRREKQLSHRRQYQICSEIAIGLEFLHGLSPPVAHRDLTDKNVMLSEEGVVKLGDLGQSKFKDNYFSTGQPGAVLFMPPEALGDSPRYTEKIDIFSLGHFPSVSLAGIGVHLEIERRREDLSKLTDGHPLKQLILLCLKDDYKERPPANIVCSFLKSHAELHTTKELLSDERKRCESADKELHTTKELLSDETERCVSAIKELHTTKELLSDEMKRRESAVKELSITETKLRYERKRCQKAFKEFDATKELLNIGLKRFENAVKELDATKEMLNDGRKRCESAVQELHTTEEMLSDERKRYESAIETQHTMSGPYQYTFKEPVRARAKSEPIIIWQKSSELLKKKYTIIVIGCSGRGKSTFCNLYCVIKDPIPGVDLHIIDTPGYLATQNRTGRDREDMAKDGELILQEFANALMYAKDGIDAIFVTLKAGERVAKEEELLMEFIEKLNLWQHCILLFTHGRDVGDKEGDRYQGFYEIIETEEFKRNCPVLVKMLAFTSNKFVIVESVGQEQDGKYYHSKVGEIIKAVAVIRDKLGAVINHPLLRMARTSWEMYMKQERLEQELQSEKQEKRKITERFKGDLSLKKMELAQVQTELQETKQKLEEAEMHYQHIDERVQMLIVRLEEHMQRSEKGTTAGEILINYLKKMDADPSKFVDAYSELEASAEKQKEVDTQLGHLSAELNRVRIVSKTTMKAKIDAIRGGQSTLDDLSQSLRN